MKEVNEVVLKMSGGDKPVPLWDEESSSSFRSLLFILTVNLQVSKTFHRCYRTCISVAQWLTSKGFEYVEHPNYCYHSDKHCCAAGNGSAGVPHVK